MLSIPVATGVAALALFAGASRATANNSCPLPSFGPGAGYHPTIDPSSFGPDITNKYLPMTPGTTYVYAGQKDGKAALDIVVVTARTKKLDGVKTRVIEDRLYLDNRLEERTSDYYAQDACANVWYFGEDTAELDAHGNVTSTEGSFHAGVDGAEPGVFMQRSPEVGREFRQEWSPGQAEDQYRVIDRSASVTTRYASWSNALRTEETTDLEPGVVDNKYYVPGIGAVKELEVKGGDEALSLVEVIK
jgi:hypothetical protein